MTSDIPELLWTAAALTAGIQGLGFLHGYWFQTEVFYDALGGINSLFFVGLAVVLNYTSFGNNANFFDESRKVSISALFAVSRLWLLAFLAWRAKERKGDGRFDELKPYFFTFLLVWIMQGVWCYCVALPLLVLTGVRGEAGKLSSPVDYLSVMFFLVGLVCEISSDIVKASWVKEGRPGGFCTRGLWYYSRHPNYFGEILMWWSAFGLCIQPMMVDSGVTGYMLLAVLSPLITTFLLLCVSGVPLAEGKHLERYLKYPDFPAYRKRTSCLVPMPPGVYERIPSLLQRLLLCEWKRYEYVEPAGASTSRQHPGSPKPSKRGSSGPRGKSRTSETRPSAVKKRPSSGTAKKRRGASVSGKK
ncbi:unnamed protein product [Amoebophrya sp. A120]|nr:unnamed protein product [Amoebophrya sp. A120]|eukprot:GSA120T00022963001.1